MKSTAKSVDEYMLEVPEDRVAAVTKLRESCRSILVGYGEGMDYTMPCYSKDGTIKVAFASQRNYISLYMNGDIVNRHRDELPKSGKGCIRYNSPEKLDFTVIEQMLRETFAETSGTCE
jgi:uncharacterized protein YdhG (YjbR/CyaY superfamily)